MSGKWGWRVVLPVSVAFGHWPWPTNRPSSPLSRCSSTGEWGPAAGWLLLVVESADAKKCMRGAAKRARASRGRGARAPRAFSGCGWRAWQPGIGWSRRARGYGMGARRVTLRGRWSSVPVPFAACAARCSSCSLVARRWT